MADSIRVGVIGFGMAGKIFHTAVVAATPGLELAAIVQRRGDEAEKAYPGVKIARSIEEMLEDESIRLVAVATPSDMHYEHAKQCLKAGRNVVVDKPFTLRSDEARKLIELAWEKKVLVTAYQNRRWDGDFVTLKQVVASGELGRIVSYESHLDRYRAEPRLAAWRESGGPGGGIAVRPGAAFDRSGDGAVWGSGEPVCGCAGGPRGRGGGRCVGRATEIRVGSDGAAARDVDRVYAGSAIC